MSYFFGVLIFFICYKSSLNPLQIIDGLEKVNEASKTIFVACDEDMEDVVLAVKKGKCTFSSDWLMHCVMRQKLDLEPPQFVESL